MIPLAVVLAVLVLIACIPAGVRLAYDDGALAVQVAIWRLHIRVYPKDPVKEAKKRAKWRRKAAKKPPKPPKEQPAKEPKSGKKLTPETIRSLAHLGLDVVGQLPKKLLVPDLILHVTFGGSNAAEIAVGYGKAWALIGALTPVLENTFRIRHRDIQALLDEELERMRVYFLVDIRMRVGTALWLCLKVLFRLLRILIQNKKKAVQANESSSV